MSHQDLASVQLMEELKNKCISSLKNYGHHSEFDNKEARHPTMSRNIMQIICQFLYIHSIDSSTMCTHIQTHTHTHWSGGRERLSQYLAQQRPGSSDFTYLKGKEFEDLNSTGQIVFTYATTYSAL